MSELKDFIIENPSVLKRPIIVDESRLQVGYNEEEIRIFIPRRLREMIMDIEVSNENSDEYEKVLEEYLEELKAKA